MSERVPFVPEVTGDRQTQNIQAQGNRVRVGLNARGPEPVTTDDLTFTAGEVKTIDHKLGRLPIEWVVVDCVTGYASFRRIGATIKTITLQSQNACTARFRVA